MSFGDSFGYPFKGGNIPKVLNIILVFLIIVSSLVVIAMLSRSEDIAVGLLFAAYPLLLAYGLFISGYMVTVIRSVMDGEELLPSAKLGRDLGRGFMVLIAGFVYAIPFIIVYMCIFAVAGASIGAMTGGRSGDADGSAIIMICGAGLLMVFMVFTIGYSFIVGLVRYAAEDTAGALFNVAENFGKVVANLGSTIGLLVRQIGLSIIYGIITQGVSMVLGGFFMGLANDPNPNIVLVIGSLIFVMIVLLSLALMNQLSMAHLFAGFGTSIGIGTAKAKAKNDDDYNF